MRGQSSSGSCACVHSVPARSTNALALGAKAVLGLRHRGWKNGKQHVAIVRFAQRILQEREGLRRRFERRLEFAKALQRIAKALARDAKIVKAQLIAPPQAAGKPPNLAQASM